MRVLTIGFILFNLVDVCRGQSPISIDKQILKMSIHTDDTIAFGKPTHSILPTVQLAHWKGGYVVFYVNSDWRTKFFFTNGHFEKITEEYEIQNRIVYQVITENNEIALLAGNKSGSRASPRSDHAFFMKISETGDLKMEKLIVGAPNVKKGNATELDDWGNYQMRWTGSKYVTFFPIQHNFRKIGPPDIHQGDCIYFINPNGEVISYSDWGASHSFEQRLMIGDSFMVTAAKGDAYPRGLDLNFIGIKEYEIMAYEKGDKDMNNTSIEYYYEPKQASGYTAFKVSGASGANYVPFSLGDIVALNNHSALISFSSKDKKVTHDIGVVRTHPLSNSTRTQLKYLTNTPTICEHSVRTASLASNRILVLWKEFDIRKSKIQIKKLDKEIDAWDASEIIFTEHNLDQNKMAIIDSMGRFVVKPQKVKKADWYYTQGLMENGTSWHRTIDGYTNHSYSPFFRTDENQLAWSHHKHKSRSIDVYMFTDVNP